jgi:hypothetical protein
MPASMMGYLMPRSLQSGVFSGGGEDIAAVEVCSIDQGEAGRDMACTKNRYEQGNSTGRNRYGVKPAFCRSCGVVFGSRCIGG